MKRNEAIEQYRKAYEALLAEAKQRPLSVPDLGDLLLAKRLYRITSILVPELEQGEPDLLNRQHLG